MLNGTEDEVTQLGQDNLIFCKENGGLSLPKPFEEYPSTTSHGLQYLSLENPRFQNFLNFASELMNEFVAENANNSVVNLLDTLKASVADFSDLIRISNTGLGTFVDTPVLHHIGIDDFLDTYLQLSSIDKVELARGIEKRYQFDDYSRLLSKELPWLIDLKDAIEKSKNSGLQSLSRVLLEVSFLSVLDKSIAKLKTLVDTHNQS